MREQLNDDEVRSIFALRGSGYSVRGIAMKMDTSHTVVHKVLTRKTFSDVKVDEMVKIRAEVIDKYFADRYRHRMTPDDLGTLVRMKLEGASQQKIADALGVSQPCISRWLSRIKDGGFF